MTPEWQERFAAMRAGLLADIEALKRGEIAPSERQAPKTYQTDPRRVASGNAAWAAKVASGKTKRPAGAGRSKKTPTCEVAWLLIGDPVPPGWRYVDDAYRCHHDHWARLIEREATP